MALLKWGTLEFKVFLPGLCFGKAGLLRIVNGTGHLGNINVILGLLRIFHISLRKACEIDIFLWISLNLDLKLPSKGKITTLIIS